MEVFFHLIYSNTIVAILISFAISYGIWGLLQALIKRKIDGGVIIFFTVVIFFSIQFSPLPPSLNRQLISILAELDHNKVNSNAAMNNILFSCNDMDMNGVRGFRYQDVIDGYHRDIDNHLKSGNLSYDISKNRSAEQWIENGDLCKAAYHFNDEKFNRIVQEGKITK